jgi:hypothetical protein
MLVQVYNRQQRRDSRESSSAGERRWEAPQAPAAAAAAVVNSLLMHWGEGTALHLLRIEVPCSDQVMRKAT